MSPTRRSLLQLSGVALLGWPVKGFAEEFAGGQVPRGKVQVGYDKLEPVPPYPVWGRSTDPQIENAYPTHFEPPPKSVDLPNSSFGNRRFIVETFAHGGLHPSNKSSAIFRQTLKDIRDIIYGSASSIHHISVTGDADAAPIGKPEIERLERDTRYRYFYPSELENCPPLERLGLLRACHVAANVFDSEDHHLEMWRKQRIWLNTFVGARTEENKRRVIVTVYFNDSVRVSFGN